MTTGTARRRAGRRGFTMVEVLVVLAVISLLITISVPHYFERIEQARETVLRDNLRVIRKAIDQYHADSGRFPNTLEDLVERRYLKALPIDPMTERHDTWILSASPEPGASGVSDVRSGAEGESRNGVPYEAF